MNKTKAPPSGGQGSRGMSAVKCITPRLMSSGSAYVSQCEELA
jgi:hypothetical protein